MPKGIRSSFASLRLYGPDQKGIVAACSHALDKFGCGIVQAETWTDRFDHLFFQRIVFDYNDHQDKQKNHWEKSAIIHSEQKMAIDSEMFRLKEQFGLNMAKINWRTQKKKVAVFVSKYDHCLVSTKIFLFDSMFILYFIMQLNLLHLHWVCEMIDEKNYSGKFFYDIKQKNWIVK